MKNHLEDILNTGEALIDQIEGTRDAVEMQLSELGAAANDLHRQIAAARTAAPHEHDQVNAATTQAINNLITLLTEAKDYFAASENLAAYGTLVMFDEHAADLKAAIRLCQMAQRRRS